MKNKRNLNTKWLLLQNDQNADTTLLHSHDEMSCGNLHMLVMSKVKYQGQKGHLNSSWKWGIFKVFGLIWKVKMQFNLNLVYRLNIEPLVFY